MPDDPGGPDDVPDGPEASGAEVPDSQTQTDKALKLNQGSRGSRTDVDHDTDPVDSQPTAPSSSIAGLDAFSAIRKIAPFLALVQLYAESGDARSQSPRARFDAYKRDHSFAVRTAYVLDFLLRLALVAVIVAVVLKGVSPFSNPFSDDGSGSTPSTSVPSSSAAP